MIRALELHLFFNRIMMEHAFFLTVTFLDKNIELKKIATSFYNNFANLLEEAINLSKGNIDKKYLNSQIAFTKYTLTAEEKTSKLTGVNLKTNLTSAENNLDNSVRNSFLLNSKISSLNKKTIPIINSFIIFKEQILDKLLKCNLFTNNHPTFMQHMINEARMYQRLLTRIEANNKYSNKSLLEQELFWNDIMKEHAIFTREKLDPKESTNIELAEKYAKEFEDILDKYSYNPDILYKESLKELIEFQNFNLAGLEGIINCKIKSIILPLLADHVFREGNYYYKLLNESYDEII